MNSVCPSCGGKAVQFDSKREARRWAELKFMERNGQIQNLRRQVRFDLVPGEYTMSGKPRYYLADFVYDEGGVTVIEDVKGNAMTREAAFKLDVLKMVLAKNGQSGFVIRLH